MNRFKESAAAIFRGDEMECNFYCQGRGNILWENLTQPSARFEVSHITLKLR
jgi:hypothetical protein